MKEHRVFNCDCEKCAAQHLKREQEPAPGEPLDEYLANIRKLASESEDPELSGYMEQIQRLLAKERAAQPPQELVSLVAKWREKAVKGRAKGRRVAKNSELTMQELTEYDSAMERCADELEAALTRRLAAKGQK